MNKAIQSEVGRVRSLKRALEAQVEFLYSEMEVGRLHLRVSNSQEFREELAKAIVDSRSSLSTLGISENYYADPIDGVIYKKNIKGMNPWPDSINWRIMSIENLVPECYDFNPDIEDWSSEDVWEGYDIKFADVIKAYLSEKGEALEDYDDPEWVLKNKEDIISFAFDSKLGFHLETIEADHRQRAIEFALESIKDSVVVEIG